MAFTEKLEANGLDEMDLKILKLLSRNAKMSFAELGTHIGLTAPAVHARAKKMEKMGVVKSYGIEIDFEKIGLPVTAFVRLQIGKLSCGDASERLKQFPEIEECHAVAGEDDLIIKTRTATPLDLQKLLDRMKAKNIYDKSVSIFVLETHFERPRV